MPNELTADGLTVLTQAELITQFIADFKAIYGDDIDLSSDTPDGQMMMIFTQAVADYEDLLVQIYNSFDPDNAVGVVLDQRVALNGIKRQGGTYSTTDIELEVTQSINIYGLDQTEEDVYTISDNAGTEWQLRQTQLGLGIATHTLEFRAKNPGAVLTVPNSITVPVTIVLGVDSINNPDAQITVGVAQETDTVLRLRRQRSTAISSQGVLDSLLALLEDVDGVTFAYVKENYTGSTDSDGVTAHSIWVIVAGSYEDADVAQAIYVKRNIGCGMYSSGGSGAKSYDVTQADGSPFEVVWDDVINVPLYIVFTATSLDKVNPPDIDAIRSGMSGAFVPGVAQQVNINDLATAIQSLDPNTLVTGSGFNIATAQVITFSGVAASGTFKISYNGTSTAAINWNDNATQIRDKIRAITGLGSITVAGTIGGQSITVTMTGVTNPYLLGYNTNSLATVAPAAITLAFFSAYTNTLTPATKNKQFAISEANVVVLGMILAGGSEIAYNINSTTGIVTNTTLAIAAAGTFTFEGLGGYGTLVYSRSTSTGSTINSSTGAYVAGTAGTDTITVTDALGNTATCTVTIS